MDYIYTAIVGIFCLIGAWHACAWMFRGEKDCDPTMIDHVKIGKDDVDERAHQDKLKLAAERHGKPFRVAPGFLTYERVHRDTPRSHDLQVIDEASRKLREGAKLAKQIEAQTNVSRIGRK